MAGRRERSQALEAWWDDCKARLDAAIGVEAYFERETGSNLIPAGEGQCLARCPFHGDTRHSLSVNIRKGLWNCKGCGAEGDLYIFHQKKYGLSSFEEALHHLASQHGVELMARPIGGRGPGGGNGGEVKSLPSPEEIQKFREDLRTLNGGIERIVETRKLTRETLDEFRVGYSKKKKRITIPVYNEHGQLVNVRLYNSRENYKMISWAKGFGKASLYGLERLKKYDPEQPVLICEGEWDCMQLCQQGFQAVTHTNGANAFKKDWRKHFEGLDVVLVYDADEGGREGARKTAGFLAGHAKSIRNIDLEEIGLVKGDEEDNDITDIARAGLENWPERLFQAIGDAEPLTLEEIPDGGPEGGDSDPFITIFEQGGRYWKPDNKKGVQPISNFILEPTRRIKVDNEEILEAVAHVAGSENGNGPLKIEMVFHPGAWVTKAAFKRSLGELGSAWKGSDDDIQEVKALMAKNPGVSRFEGIQAAGIHHRKKEYVFVTKEKAFTEKEEVEGLVWWNDQVTRPEYDLEKFRPATSEEIRAVAAALMDFNAIDIAACVNSWMFSCPFKARFPNAVPTLRRQFPLLILWGERGSGKTKTAEQIIGPFFGDFLGPLKIDEMTKYSLMVYSNATKTLPLVYDEYKPSKMNQRAIQEVSGYIRSIYNSERGARGYAGGPHGGGVTEYVYQAPIVLMGEQTLIEPAIKERVIEAIFTKDKREGHDIERFHGLNVAGTGFQYIRWTLGLQDQEIEQVWKDQFAQVSRDSFFRDRIAQNVATMRTGIEFWRRFISEHGATVDFSEMIEALSASQHTNLLEGGEKPKNDIDLILEGMSSMAAMGTSLAQPLRKDEDYKIDEDEMKDDEGKNKIDEEKIRNDGNKICLRVQTLYPKFRRWAREYGFDSEVLDEKSFKKRLKMEPYFDEYKNTRFGHRSEIQAKAFILDLSILRNSGVDISGFGVEPPKDKEYDDVPPF